VDASTAASAMAKYGSAADVAVESMDRWLAA
jgi:hypothetical protein